MTDVMPASGLEQMLTDIADRLGRQEEYTRRIEASLFALARLPDDPLTTTDFTIGNVVETPRPRHTPTDIRWPHRRNAPEPVRSLAEDDRTADSDLLWAIAGLVHDPLVGLDKDGHVRVWNPSAEDLFGWTAEETIGKAPPFLPDDKQLEHERLTADGRFGKPARDFQTVRRRKDGQLVRVEISTAGVGGGIAFTLRPIGIPCRPTFAESESSPPEPIIDDVRIHGLAAVGRQVAAVAHDFNNLLTIICGGTERLIEQFEDGDTRREVAELVATAGRQATDMTRGLLDLACIGSGTGHAEAPAERCDLTAVVSAHAPVLQGLLGPERALVLGITNRPAEISADPVRIGQVLLNLATNSRDAMPDGGTLAVEVDFAELSDFIASRKGPVAMLTVSDTGVGMDAETLSHAFEPFFTTKAPGVGCGLGLATVADIITSVGGTVIPESSPGTGTTIRILFPLIGSMKPVFAIRRRTWPRMKW